MHPFQPGQSPGDEGCKSIGIYGRPQSDGLGYYIGGFVTPRVVGPAWHRTIGLLLLGEPLGRSADYMIVAAKSEEALDGIAVSMEVRSFALR